MLSNILGIIWILLGLLWILKPQMLRRRLIKKTNRKIKWAVFIFTIVLAFSLIGTVFKAEGILLRVVGLVGIFLAVKAIFLLTAKSSTKLADWANKRALVFFRTWGVVVLLLGIFLLLAK
ncbi:MAG: hypothetical protein HQ595_01100 [Candidatus Omnitrophica bacterium]|nr:hypothetical protein [Candidatus Omnitrophota bacterium]